MAFPGGVRALATARVKTTNYVAAGSDRGAMTLFEADSRGRLSFVQRFGQHSDAVDSLTFHPNGTRLVAGSSDRSITVWDVDSGFAWISLQGHAGSVIGLAFSPDGSTLVSSSRGYEGTDNTLKLWETSSPHRLSKRNAKRP